MHCLMRSLMPNKDGCRWSLVKKFQTSQYYVYMYMCGCISACTFTYVACRFIFPLEYVHIYISMNIYIYIYIHRERRVYTDIMQSHMRSQKSCACLMQCLMRSNVEFPLACAPNVVQNHARKQPEFRQCLILSVMRDLRRIRPFKNRASEFTSYAPLNPRKMFVE